MPTTYMQRAAEDERIIAALVAEYPSDDIGFTRLGGESGSPSTTALAAMRLRELIDETRPLPRELTHDVREVLGMMLWQTTPIAHALRAAGREIPASVDLEQAHVLHWLLGFAIEHGATWHQHAARELHKIITAAQGH
ncbi:protein of unknown function [Pararobbsia alpina]|uniref:hypothetical protein n=1 Tax=Pararobbsia alpina TaxID=621374 RepID=UPI0039A4CD6B